MTESCLTCKFYWPNPPRANLDATSGVCRCDPPVRPVAPEVLSRDPKSKWPVTQDDYWCGRWKAK